MIVCCVPAVISLTDARCVMRYLIGFEEIGSVGGASTAAPRGTGSLGCRSLDASRSAGVCPVLGGVAASLTLFAGGSASSCGRRDGDDDAS